MRTDPFASIEDTLREGYARFLRDDESSRGGWNDDTRKAFDSQHGERVHGEARAALAALTAVRTEIALAVSELRTGDQTVDW